MANLLDEFSDENYKKNENTDNQKQPSIVNENRNRSGAFKQEEVKVDSNYFKYKYLRQIIVIIVVFLLVIISIILYNLNNYTVVINYSDLPISEAEQWAKENDINYIIKEEYSNDIESELVISQNYDTGYKMTKSDVIEFVVSKGADPSEYVKVPDFTEKDFDDIKKFITENTLVNADIKEIYSSLPKGEFINVVFADGVGSDTYTRGDSLIFNVSKGQEKTDFEYIVKDFTYKNRSEVEEWAIDKGITVKYEEVKNPKFPLDFIISQSLESGTKMNFGDIITFEVSLGTGSEMINFNNLSEEEAEQAAIDNDIEIIKYYAYNDYIAKGTLISQSIAEGDSYYTGDKVELLYSLGKVYIDNYIGLTINDTTNALDLLNDNYAHLSYKVEYVDSEEFTRGQVVDMSKYGEYVNRYSTIIIKVAN